MFVILKRNDTYTFGTESNGIILEGDEIIDRKEDIRSTIDRVAELNRNAVIDKSKKLIKSVEENHGKPSTLKFP